MKRGAPADDGPLDDPLQDAITAQVAAICGENGLSGALEVKVEVGTSISATRRQRIRDAAEAAAASATGAPAMVRLRVLERLDRLNDDVRVTVTPIRVPETPTIRFEPPQQRATPRTAPLLPRTRVDRTEKQPYPIGLTSHWSLVVYYQPDVGAVGGLRFSFALAPEDGWTPFGRELNLPPGSPGLDFGVLRALPRGALVEVRCGDGGLLFRRAYLRPGYVVSVNGRVVGSDVELSGGWEGTVVYNRPPSMGQTILRFELERRGAV